MFDMRAIFTRSGPYYPDRLWQAHSVRLITPPGDELEMPAELQIVSEKWNVRAQVPYLVYMPETDRLVMIIQAEHQPAVIMSDDRGATWSRPRFAHEDLCITPERFYFGIGLSYLGNGTAIFTSAEGSCNGTDVWFSYDYGETWNDRKPLPRAFDGKCCHQWDPFLVDRNSDTGATQRIMLAGYTYTTDMNHTLGFVRFSDDLCDTWSTDIVVPQWDRKNEIALVRAANGDIVAAPRLDPSDEDLNKYDHYTGFGISISKDNGYTWSEVETVYDVGRHHTSTVLLPNGDLVMSYVVRLGYPDTAEGIPQFGVEAVVSHDNGRSWDLEHRYVLHRWNVGRKDRVPWHRSVQQTSSVILPDGTIYTAFGTYYRSEPAENGLIRPLDVGLVRWRPEQD